MNIMGEDNSLPDEIGLQESLKIAYEQNLDIKTAIIRKYLSDSNIQLSFSRLYPNININSSFSRSDIKRTGIVNIEGVEFEVSDKSSSETYSYGISLSQWIFLPQNIMDIRNIADSDKKLSILAYQEQLQNIYHTIINRYFNYLKNLSMLELAEEDLETTKDHYNKTLHMFDLGLIDKLALSNAELNLQNKEFNLIRAKNDLSIARMDFLNQIGIPIDSNIRIIDDNIRFSNENLDLQHNYDHAINNNISINYRKEQLNNAQFNYRRAVHENLPNISLSSGFNYASDEFPTSDYRFSNTISISFNLFRGFQDKYNMSINRLRTRENEIELNKVKEEIRLRLGQTLANISVSESLLSLSTKREEMAQNDIELAEARYSSGLAIYLEVEDAKISYIRAKSDRISSYYDHIIANISLLINRGDFLDTVEEIILN